MRILSILIFCSLSTTVLAETVLVDATQDNTLYESAQGALSNGAGIYLFAGKTVDKGRRRAVLAFKDLSAVPVDAQIVSVKLHMYMSKEDSPETVIRLYRLESDWGEGSSNASGQEGGGGMAMAGDATWNHRFFDNMLWGSPGGDFAATASAQMPIDNIGAYTFGSTDAMLADVQGWLESPASNFGWILLAAEDVKSARRFNSRENATVERRPMLEIEFSTSGSTGPSPESDFSGPWYDPELDGEGFLMFKTPAGWLIYYFGYSADMQRLWLASNLLDIENLQYGQEYEFSLLVGEPGTFNMPTPSTEFTPWGTLRILFNDCVSGVFVLDGLDGQQVFNIQKLIGVKGTTCEDG